PRSRSSLSRPAISSRRATASASTSRAATSRISTSTPIPARRRGWRGGRRSRSIPSSSTPAAPRISLCRSSLNLPERPMAKWTESYRGIVKSWKCNVFDHLTIPYDYDHYEDASQLALDAFAGRHGPSRTTNLYVRHLREFRAGDSLHIVSAPIAAGNGSLTLGHKVLDSATGDLCATVEQSLEFGVRDRIAAAPLPWDG